MANAKKKAGKKKVAAKKKPSAAVPTDNTLPSIFAGLGEADIEHPEFELCDPAQSDSNVRAWLGGLPKDGSRVIVFAQDGTGSLFGVWLRLHHADVETAPIVYLGSEGEIGVLGKDPPAFIELLGSAMSFDGHTGTFFLDDEDDDDELVRDFRERTANFAKETLGLKTLRKPDAIKKEAEKAYPDLQAWVDANNAHR